MVNLIWWHADTGIFEVIYDSWLYQGTMVLICLSVYNICVAAISNQTHKTNSSITSYPFFQNMKLEWYHIDLYIFVIDLMWFFIIQASVLLAPSEVPKIAFAEKTRQFGLVPSLNGCALRYSNETLYVLLHGSC